MSTDQDVERIQAILGPSDPVDPDEGFEDDILAVRHRLGHGSGARTTRVLVAAAAAVVLVAGGLPFVRAPAAWAETEVAGIGPVIRVEMPEFYQRGADPDTVVSVLRDHGVDVETVTQTDLTPWKVGAVVGQKYGFSPGFGGPDTYDRWRSMDRRDLLADVGIAPLPDGGVEVAPDIFTGSLTIMIGRFPGF